MKGYRENVAPTEKGLDELDESTRYATIERLIAGIQCKKTKPEKLLELTAHFRKRHSYEDAELYRLGDFSKDYNKLWATKNNRCFNKEEMMLNKRQSQYKSWREMLKITSPRFKPKPNESEDPQSIYEASFLTYRPYEQDIWGPASYGTLIYDLWGELNVIVKHMQDGRKLCDDMIEEEAKIDKDPERKEQLFWDQYRSIAERNQDTIELHVKKGIVNTDNPVYRKMLTYPDTITGLAHNDFHYRSETQMSDFVITHSTLTHQNNNITPTENILFGQDFEKIKIMRFAAEHADELLSITGNKFDKSDILFLIKWLNPLKSTKSHKDNEHVLFDCIKARYQGTVKWRGWPTIFELRNHLGYSERGWQNVVKDFGEKVMKLYNSYTKVQDTPQF